MATEKPPLSLIKKPDPSEDDRRQSAESPEVERRSRKDRREKIVARGYFEQYVNLYNMMYESPSVTPQISQLLAKILNDPEWQAVLAQEVSTDRQFKKKKNRNDLRSFFRKHGVIEDDPAESQKESS